MSNDNSTWYTRNHPHAFDNLVAKPKPKKEKVKRPHFMGDTDVHKKDPPASSLPSPKMERFMTDSEWYKSEQYRRLLPKKLKEERK